MNQPLSVDGACRKCKRKVTGKETSCWAPAWWRMLFWPILLWLIWLMPVCGQTVPLTKIATLHQYVRATAAEAAQGLPVQFGGTVICYDFDWGQLYLQDGTNTLYLSPRQFTNRLEVGQYVEIRGTSALVEGARGLTNAEAIVIQERQIPPAKRAKLSQLHNSLGQWIETTGRVRAADTSRGRLGLTIQDGSLRCQVYVLGQSQNVDFKRLIDHEIRLRGINGSKVVQGRLESAMVMVPGMNEITDLESSKGDLTRLPVVSIDALLNRELGPWTNHLVHLSCLVSTYKPGETMVVRDPTGVLRAEVIQIAPLQPGDRIRLWGYLEVLPDEAVLRDAFFEQATAAPRPTAPRVSTTDADIPKVLEKVSEIMALPRESLALGIPVKLRGTMIYADAEYHNGFFRDASDSIFVELTQAGVSAGQWVELTGRTQRGGFAPQVSASEVRVLGTTNWPVAVRADLEDLADGHLDSHWIEMEGVVRRAELEWGHLNLTVSTRKGGFKAVVPNLGASPKLPRLVDALVSIQGACGSTLNSVGQLSGITLHVPALDRITILEKAPGESFEAPVTAIAAVSTFDASRSIGHRVKIRGVVTLLLPQSGFFAQDTTGGIRVSTQATNDVHVGDSVEVLGFPTIGDYSPCLDEAAVRVISHGVRPLAKRTTAEKILLQGDSDGQVVELEAELAQSITKSARPKLLLQDGTIIFTANFSGRLPDWGMMDLKQGSKLRVTGICDIQSSDGHEPEAFRLLIPRPQDVELVNSPPWWNSRYTLVLAGSLGLAMLLALTWVGSLRRTVREQTSLIRQKLEERKEFAESLAREKTLLRTLIDHLPDNVFVKDKAGRYLLANQAHLRFHGLTGSEQVVGKSSSDILCASEVGFAVEMDQKTMTGGCVVENEVYLRDSVGNIRCFLTTKVPLRDGENGIIGLVGISRDITERKRAQAELEQINKQLLDTSRLAGMAEVASSVLHNVGNVLNSVNVSCILAAEQVRASKGCNVSRVATLMEAHAGDLGHFLTEDPKGRQIVAYLGQLASQLAEEQAFLLRELGSLTWNIEHIKDIVAMQQNHARVGGVVETVDVSQLLEDALRVNAGALERHGLQIERDYETAQPCTITVEKNKVLQILVNLIQNAKYACAESTHQDKRLMLRIRKDGGRVKILITDNGVGIPPENLIRMFNFGFTTRSNGHGFGLHSCALAAEELKGSLHARSDGLGQGATFTLELPLTTDCS